MRRWDVVVGVSGAVAVLAFAFLIVVMVNPRLAEFSAVAYLALAAGVLGTALGIAGMSRTVAADGGFSESDDAFSMAGRLDIYRQLRGRGSD